MAILLHPRLETFNYGPGGFASFISRYPGKDAIAPHFHPRLELVVFSGVGGEIRVGGYREEIEESRSYIIGPNAIHSYELKPLNPGHAAWVLIIDLETMAQTLASYGLGVKDNFLDTFHGLELATDWQEKLAQTIRKLAEGRNDQLENQPTKKPAVALAELSSLFSAVQLALLAAGGKTVGRKEKIPGDMARRVIALFREKA